MTTRSCCCCYPGSLHHHHASSFLHLPEAWLLPYRTIGSSLLPCRTSGSSFFPYCASGSDSLFAAVLDLLHCIFWLLCASSVASLFSVTTPSSSLMAAGFPFSLSAPLFFNPSRLSTSPYLPLLVVPPAFPTSLVLLTVGTSLVVPPTFTSSRLFLLSYLTSTPSSIQASPVVPSFFFASLVAPRPSLPSSDTSFLISLAAPPSFPVSCVTPHCLFLTCRSSLSLSYRYIIGSVLLL